MDLSPRTLRRAAGALTLTVFFGLALTVSLGGCAADIRPDGIKRLKAPKASAQAKGRALLERAAARHGYETWKTIETYTMTLRDEWEGLPSMMSPWPDKHVRVRMDFRAGSFDARASFLSGSKKGHTWGMQSWKTYTTPPGKPATFAPNGDIAFLLPAIQYLFEFHFRDHAGQVVTYAGPETIRGTRYERVFVTWGSLEPSGDVDQYLVYIDPETGLVRKLFYTVREMADMVTGAIHYDAYRDVGGVMVPFLQYVTLSVYDDPKDYAHVLKLEDVTWNEPPASTFRVDPGLVTVDDAKL